MRSKLLGMIDNPCSQLSLPLHVSSKLPNFPSFKSLRVLSIESCAIEDESSLGGIHALGGIPDINALPPNRLRRVYIIRCPQFKSFENMENIPFVLLESLNFTSLAGLGPKNRIVKLVRMIDLKDISSLKGSYKVRIYDRLQLHKNLNPSNQFQHSPTLLKQFQAERLQHGLLNHGHMLKEYEAYLHYVEPVSGELVLDRMCYRTKCATPGVLTQA